MLNKKDKKYWKCQPCKKGDLVEISEDLYYTAKTLYKVAYFDPSRRPPRILVEVIPERNHVDRGRITGWTAYKALSKHEIEKYQVDSKKDYWWIFWWNIKDSKISFLENE